MVVFTQNRCAKCPSSEVPEPAPDHLPVGSAHLDLVISAGRLRVIGLSIAGQPRVAVHPVPLKCHIVGPDVPLLKHPDVNAKIHGNRMGVAMDGSAITEEQHGINPFVLTEPTKPRGPCLHGPPVVDGMAWEKEPVAGIEVDLGNRRSGGF